MEVESSKTKQTLSEAQSRNQYLQDQVGMQREVLKEMEQQLQSSQKAAAQLRAQVSPPEHEEAERRPEAEGKGGEGEAFQGDSLARRSGRHWCFFVFGFWSLGEGPESSFQRLRLHFLFAAAALISRAPSLWFLPS